MIRDSLQRFAAATSAALLVVSAAAPIDASAQSSTNPTRAPGSTTVAPFPVPPNPELVFEPIQPCRAFATGASNGGGAIPVDTTRNFYVAGTTGFDTQGGASGGCGVPASATAVAITVTAYNIASATSGKVIAYPYGNALPSTVAISFSPNINQTSNVTVGVNQSQISLQAKNNAIQVAGDITGYYLPQIEAYIFASGQIYSATTRIVSATRTAVGEYHTIIDRNVQHCAVQVSIGSYNNGYLVSKNSVSDNDVFVRIFSFNYGSFSAADSDFNLTVHC